MKTICIILISSFITSLIWKVFHKCPVSESEKVEILKKAVAQKDSLLNLWFNDYTWHIRVLAGVEKDSLVTKFQKWNNKK